jgi:hypothetical protein
LVIHKTEVVYCSASVISLRLLLPGQQLSHHYNAKDADNTDKNDIGNMQVKNMNISIQVTKM